MKIKLIAALMAATALLSAPVANAEVTISTKGGLKVSSDDYKFQFGGRIMYDYDKTETNGETTKDEFDLRRGRVFAAGNIATNWKFKTQFNTNGDGVEDLYLRYTGWGKGANVTIGNQKVPFMLEELTSSKDISVLERGALTEAFAIGRAESIQLHGALAGNQTYAASLFFDDVNEEETGEESGFAARYTIAPVKSDTSVLHLGIAYRDIEDDSALGLELGAAAGPFHFQAEYVDGEAGDVDVDGYYAQVGYILTGESRPYKGGKFKRVKPSGSAGAWELVARYTDGFGKYSDVGLSSTDGSATTIGVNWYAHKNVKLGINYMDGEEDASGEEGDELRVRFQLTF